MYCISLACAFESILNFFLNKISLNYFFLTKCSGLSFIKSWNRDGINKGIFEFFVHVYVLSKN